MRFRYGAGAATVCLFAGLIVPGYAQRDDKQRGDKQEEKQAGRQSQGHGQQAKPQQQERAPQAQQQREQQAPQRAQTPQQQPQAPQAPQQQRERQHAQQPQQRAQQPQEQQPARQPQQQPQQRVQQAQPPAGREQPAQRQQRAQQQQQQPRQQQPQAEQRSILSQIQQPQRSRQQAQSWQQQRGWLKQGGGWQGHDNFQQDSSRNWNSDHRSWSQRGGYGGYYIPQYSFNLYFGSQHFFRFLTAPVMYLGYPRFEYQGISFLLLDPWPANWSQNWYEADDVYIDYDDGYYLYNRDYPRQRLAITILV